MSGKFEFDMKIKKDLCCMVLSFKVVSTSTNFFDNSIQDNHCKYSNFEIVNTPESNSLIYILWGFAITILNFHQIMSSLGAGTIGPPPPPFKARYLN